jgi:TolA-binding protein
MRNTTISERIKQLETKVAEIEHQLNTQTKEITFKTHEDNFVEIRALQSKNT